MRYSQIYIPTKKSIAKTDSINAHLLTRAGFISQVAAGVYALLPLAVRSIRKIEQIVREEMNAIGGSEVSLSALQQKSTWEKSGRWSDPEFRQILYYDTEVDMALAPTHEEPMTQVIKESVQSYRDLPVILYQFQTKFRKELRAKSGLLRGREFRMKDLYSFHPDAKAHDEFYEQCAVAYSKVFDRLGLEAYRIKAAGGIFSSEFSDEYQVICPTGEDEILVNHSTKSGYNKEVEDQIPTEEKASLERVKAIEVGNIFHLGTKYSDAVDLEYLDQKGDRKQVFMGSYGIGITRLLGTLAEIYNDEDGLKLPRQVSPFDIEIIDLTDSGEGEKLTGELEAAGYEVLLDDRDTSTGAKLVDADLIGAPIRLVYSPKTAAENMVEVKNRATGEVTKVARAELISAVSNSLS